MPQPDKDHPWACEDREAGEITYHATLREAQVQAQQYSDSWHDEDGWGPEVEEIMIYKVTHRVRLVKHDDEGLIGYTAEVVPLDSWKTGWPESYSIPAYILLYSACAFTGTRAAPLCKAGKSGRVTRSQPVTLPLREGITPMEILLALPWALFAIFCRSLCLTWLWSWFIAQPFHVQEISVAHAFGLALLLTYFLPVIPQEHLEWPARILKALISPVIFLAIGWLISRAM